MTVSPKSLSWYTFPLGPVPARTEGLPDLITRRARRFVPPE